MQEPGEEKPVVVRPDDEDDALGTVIWLHGLGADGHDFEPLVPALSGEVPRRLRFVFPHAPFRPVTINGGMVMRAWYDIADPELDRGADEAGVRESVAILTDLLDRETQHGVAPERVVLAGFSQGGAIVLHTALGCAQRVAGVMALSGYLPLEPGDAAQLGPANRETPIFMAHGAYDPVVPIELAQRSRDLLSELGYRVEWREYPMPHAVCPAEIADISTWLEGVFG